MKRVFFISFFPPQTFVTHERAMCEFPSYEMTKKNNGTLISFSTGFAYLFYFYYFFVCVCLLVFSFRVQIGNGDSDSECECDTNAHTIVKKKATIYQSYSRSRLLLIHHYEWHF